MATESQFDSTAFSMITPVAMHHGRPLPPLVASLFLDALELSNVPDLALGCIVYSILSTEQPTPTEQVSRGRTWFGRLKGYCLFVREAPLVVVNGFCILCRAR